MNKKGKKPSLTLHRETLKALESADLEEAAGGITRLCPPTYTGIEGKPCIC